LVSTQGLFQDLFAVGDEQETRKLSAAPLAQGAVVQGRHDGLARAGGGDQKVLVVASDLAFDAEAFQHVPLVRERLHLETR
jgi:NADPH-dependent 2,4-dienoyl-CoA reductase/sulfur reductase-like enzyme